MAAISLRRAVLPASVMTLAGCGVGMEPLMPTPIVYTEAGISPLKNVPESEHWTPRRVYYATNRKRSKDLQKIFYGNEPSDMVSVGLALIGFGGPDMTWADLDQASRSADRDEDVQLSIAGVIEAGHFSQDSPPVVSADPSNAGWLIRDLNHSIAESRDHDVLVYVHGAKVNFYNACAFAAQLDHFMGRDMTSIAFSWPTRQDIFAYAFGSDRHRAKSSAVALASVLEALAEGSNARKIHVLCWSAGARVLTQTFLELRARYPDESEESLRQHFRIGTAYFAAGDVPRDVFLEALPTIHALAERTVVTTSSHDEALITAKVIMSEDYRLGQVSNSLTAEQIAYLESLDRFEAVNLSIGSEDRGFDITGHRYWFDHPWASTDVLLTIRSDFPPPERGLVPSEKYPFLWYMPEDYPQRVMQSLQAAGGHLRSDE